jgi:Domain of unknown function (DUF1905)/Bacteriocin-protection, YdeI or OmpD-Associated
MMTDAAEYSFEGTLDASESKIYQTHILVPATIASALLSHGAKRVVATIKSNDGDYQYQCGLIPFGKGKTGIMVNKHIRTTLKLQEGTKVHVHLQKDTSEYGLAMPEEFEELLRQDEDGSRLFHALSQGKQRTLLYIVSSVKNSERRIERAVTVMQHLKEHQGKVDYKNLYENLKVSKRFE